MARKLGSGIGRYFWALTLSGSLCSGVGASANHEFRGLWIDAFGPGFLNPAEVKALVEDCRKYNFNAVMVEMRRRGDAFYFPQSPNLDPRTTIIATNFDALAEIIKECHTGTPRIEVHCWIVSHFVWAWEKPPIQPTHIFNLHPEFLTRDSIGQKFIEKGYFLDPGNPDANLTIYNTAKDLVRRYDIDGLHWDYCRYPNQDSGYNETALKRYNQEFGLTGSPSPKDLRFSAWRRRQVSDFLRWVNADLLEIKSNLVISAAVFANLNDAFAYRFQDWPDWTRQGILDACIPMDFSPDNQNIFFPRADAARTNQGPRHIYLGQGAYMNPPENTLTQLIYARTKSFPGTVLYSYRTISPTLSQTLSNPLSNPLSNSPRDSLFLLIKDKLQPQWASTPPLPWKKTKAILKGTVTARGAATPIYNASLTCVPELKSQISNLKSQGFPPPSPISHLPSPMRTEPHGKYAFFDLAPGPYTITAAAPGSPEVTKTITLSPGEILTFDFALQP